MIKQDYFNPDFIAELMQAHSPEDKISIGGVTMFEIDNSASILAVLASATSEALIGHFGLAVDYTKNGIAESKRMVMKIKPHGDEIVNMLASLATACGPELSEVYEKYKHLTGFQFTHLREQEIYKKLKPDFAPEIYGLYTNREDDIYLILMEYLEDVTLLNSVMQTEKWTDKHIKTALAQLANWHSRMLNYKNKDLDFSIWATDEPNAIYMTQLIPLWTALLQNATKKSPEIYTEKRSKNLQKAIDKIPQWIKTLENASKTLIHNDLNPRNTCFKNINGELAFCTYDWELATFQIPQYDVVEFLCFVLQKDRYHLRFGYLEFYRNELNDLTNGAYPDAKSFKQEFLLVALTFGIHRLGMYMMAHSVSPYPFLPSVADSFFDTISGSKMDLWLKSGNKKSPNLFGKTWGL